VAIAARICPNDVRLTLEQAIPGGMSLEDYSLMREVIAAIREGLPSADQLQPGAAPFRRKRRGVRPTPGGAFLNRSTANDRFHAGTTRCDPR
jgi:hypothetical protein